MSDLKACPLPDCGGKASVTKGEYSGKPIQYRCDPCGIEADCDAWQALPRQSDDLKGIAVDLYRLVALMPPEWGVEVRKCASRLDAIAEPQREPRVVESETVQGIVAQLKALERKHGGALRGRRAVVFVWQEIAPLLVRLEAIAEQRETVPGEVWEAWASDGRGTKLCATEEIALDHIALDPSDLRTETRMDRRKVHGAPAARDEETNVLIVRPGDPKPVGLHRDAPQMDAFAAAEMKQGAPAVPARVAVAINRDESVTSGARCSVHSTLNQARKARRGPSDVRWYQVQGAPAAKDRECEIRPTDKGVGIFAKDSGEQTAKGEKLCETCGFWLGGGIRGRCNHKTALSTGPRDLCSDHIPRNTEALPQTTKGAYEETGWNMRSDPDCDSCEKQDLWEAVHEKLADTEASEKSLLGQLHKANEQLLLARRPGPFVTGEGWTLYNGVCAERDEANARAKEPKAALDAARRGWDSADGRADRREAERDSACDERDAAQASLAAAVRISDQAAREAGSARADLAALIITYENEPGQVERVIAAIKKSQPIRSVRYGAGGYRAAWADAVKEAGYTPCGVIPVGPTSAAIARASAALAGKHDELSYEAGYEFDKAMLEAVEQLAKRMDATEGDTFDLHKELNKNKEVAARAEGAIASLLMLGVKWK